jgi:U3 small nucleolar RNA-associated protein 12
MWHETGHREEVTCICQSPQSQFFAVGYADGSIRLWNKLTGSVLTTFNGHKKAITALAFDDAGVRLASGSQDTDLILWDIVGEAGLYRYEPLGLLTGEYSSTIRLRGHRDQITEIKFLSFAEDQPSTSAAAAAGLLLTASKDTFMKLWDLSTQHCVQTVVAHRSEVWSLDINLKKDMLFTGSGEGELKAWKIDREAIKKGLNQTETGEVISTKVIILCHALTSFAQIAKMIHPTSGLPLASKYRVSQIKFHPFLPYLAVQSHDRSVEIFRIRSEEEVRKKMERRRKRTKEKMAQDRSKKKDKDRQDPEGVTEVSIDPTEPQLVDYFIPHVIVRASGKVRSFDIDPRESNLRGGFKVWTSKLTLFNPLIFLVQKLFVALSNNAIEVYNVPPPTKSKDDVAEATLNYAVNLPGHRTDIRTLCLSSDDEILASASNGQSTSDITSSRP